MASGLSETDDTQQVSTLLYCLGEEAESVLDSTNATADDRKKYDTVLSKFDSFFQVRCNMIFERARFNRRCQKDGETVEQYIMELYRLADNCSYEGMKEEMIRDRLVVGIRDEVLSQQLQMDPELTLEKAKTKARQREAVGEQQKALKGASAGGDSPSLEEIQSRRWQRGPGTKKQPRRKSHTHKEANKCTRCGREPHPRDRCPAKDAECLKCGKKGHYKALCFSKTTTSKKLSEVTSQDVLETAYLDTVTSNQTAAWIVTVDLNNVPTEVKLDTGAEVTAISKETYQKLGSPQLASPTKSLYGPSRLPLKTLGSLQCKVAYKDVTATQSIYVIDGLKTNLLGLPAIEALQLAVRVASVTKADSGLSSAAGVERQFPSIFTGLGNLGEEYEISLKPGATPYSLYTPRNVALPLRPKVQEELNRMEALGVISKVEEATPWCAGMVVVPKKEGALRICVDLKPLNENVLREIHPLPKVDDTLAQLSSAKVFSKLDANSGFWQIPLAKKSRLLTTFITPYGRYCFNKLPFGITSAPEHFQKRMSKILYGLNGVLCLIDDVLIFGKDTKEHDARLLAALKRIQEAGVTLNRSKCSF